MKRVIIEEYWAVRGSMLTTFSVKSESINETLL